MNLIKIIIFLPLFCNAQVSWQIKSDESVKWYYQFGDEFNDKTLDEKKWLNGLPWGNAVMSQDFVFANKNVEFNDGSIKFISNKEDYKIKLEPWQIDSVFLKKNKIELPNQIYTAKYTAGLISSKQKFKYGYFEIRFKSTGQRGTWPAFWLYGGEPNEEIDFFELKGELNNKIHVDVHCPNGCANYRGGFLNLKRDWGAWISAKNNLEDGWNIVSGEWDKGYVKWFLNGQPLAYFKGEFKTDQMLILNTAIAKDNGAFSPGPDESTKWPNAFEVDYVRVWSKEDTISRYQNNYKLFEKSVNNIAEEQLFQTEMKKKENYVYNKQLISEQGMITLLPIFYNKYSLSIQGKKLGRIQVDVLNNQNIKVTGFSLENVEYYVLDLSALPTGAYKIVITVLNQTLTHEIPVINPDKIGEQ